ncbi:MAG: hypothetical protein DMD81_02345 [Candidatus Rokuibacteriota bacterium]|nr:MAG: hypothetical protein DMD81_02345 [Candidatus Rokubacteria bacterium]
MPQPAASAPSLRRPRCARRRHGGDAPHGRARPAQVVPAPRLLSLVRRSGSADPCGRRGRADRGLAWTVRHRALRVPEPGRVSGLPVREPARRRVRARHGHGSVPPARSRPMARAHVPAADSPSALAAGMKRRVIVIGAGMGGLTAASRLARLGHDVRLFEARAGPGGLASGVEFSGTRFDAGPYVLLDRPGLAWALDAVGVDLEEIAALQRIDELYSVTSGDGESLEFFTDGARTAAAVDRRWPGSGRRYEAFVRAVDRVYMRTRPLLTAPPPRLRDMLRTGAWRDLAFLRRSLDSVLARSGLPREVVDAIAIWTHIAGQDPAEAPSVLALIPAALHRFGAYYPRGGISTIPCALARHAAAHGVEFTWGVSVRSIRTRAGRVVGVETDRGVTEADAVLSNAHGLGTHLELLDPVPEPARRGTAPAVSSVSPR